MGTPLTAIARRRIGTLARAALDPAALLPAPRRGPTATPVAGLVGYYGWGNYGDELFYQVFEQHLADPIRLERVLDPHAGRFRGRAIGSAVNRSDVLVIGGGDIVIPWLVTSRYFERAYLRRPVFVTGVGVPTWEKPLPEAVDVLARFFRDPAVRRIAARDPASVAWIRDTLTPAVPVEETPDLVCALRLPEVERPADPPIFGIAVRRRAKPDDLAQVRRLGEQAQALGYRLRRIVLATGPTRAADMAATRELGFEDTELVSSDSLDAITRAIGECTAMASMKFHGVVVAAMYGIPAIVLMPTHKNRRFMEALGRPDLVSSFADTALADRVTRDPVPIPEAVRAQLRDGAEAHLRSLKAQILATTANPGGR